jgi:predicted NBD/HSP70 family sugar kinase
MGAESMSFDDAAALARSGNPAAVEIFAVAGQTLGKAIAVLVNLVGPASIVLAGEAIPAWDLIRVAALDAFRAHAFGAAGEVDIQVIPHTFDDWARGAAADVIWAVARGQ